MFACFNLAASDDSTSAIPCESTANWNKVCWSRKTSKTCRAVLENADVDIRKAPKVHHILPKTCSHGEELFYISHHINSSLTVLYLIKVQFLCVFLYILLREPSDSSLKTKMKQVAEFSGSHNWYSMLCFIPATTAHTVKSRTLL